MLSVVVVTFRRLPLLQRCLASVQAAAAEYPGDAVECIVGVNSDGVSPDPATLEWLRDLSPGACAMRVIGLESALSPAAARNRVLPEARGEWILFLDDDAEIPSDYFRRFAACLSGLKDPSIAAVGGPNVTARGSSLLQRAIGVALASRFATYLSVSRYRPAGDSRECGEEALMLCNLFARRDALGSDPFPPEFVCAEENWLIEELKSRGFRAHYDPALSVWHERRPNLGALAMQVFRYGIGRAQHVRRKPSSLRFAHVFPSLCLLYALATPALSLPLVPFEAYPALALIAAIRSGGKLGESLKARLLAALLFPVIHVSYGAGVLFGLAR